MDGLTDTNILLRGAQPLHPMHVAAAQAVDILIEQGQRFAVAMQNVAEFWNVATRPSQHNGLGWSTDDTARAVAKIERDFKILYEDAGCLATWKELITTHKVCGVKVHDARLVAVMKCHGIRRILTFNTADYARYPEIEAIHPESVQ